MVAVLFPKFCLVAPACDLIGVRAAYLVILVLPAFGAISYICVHCK